MATYIGTDKLAKMYLGTDEVKKVYVGTDLVYNSSVALTLCGAPGETVTITGAYTGSVTLGSDGTYSFSEFPSGTSVFTGDFTTGMNDWEARSATLTEDTTIGLWPSTVNMVYWYGYKADGTSIAYGYSVSEHGSMSHSGKEETYSDSRKRIHLYTSATQNDAYTTSAYQRGTVGSVDLTDYSTLYFTESHSATGSGQVSHGYRTGYATSAGGDITSASDISSLSGTYYIGIRCYSSIAGGSGEYTGGCNQYMMAAWMD